MNGWQQNNLQFRSEPSLTQHYLYPSQHKKSTDRTSSKDIRQAADLLDTKQWSSSATLAVQYLTLGTHSPLTFVTEPYTSLDEPFALYGTPACAPAPEPHVIPHSQAITDLSSSRPTAGSMESYHENLGTGVSSADSSPGYRPSISYHTEGCAFATASAVPLLPPGSTDHTTHSVRDGRGPPLMIYRPPQENGSGRPHTRHARAIKIEGLWIDEDDLYIGAQQSGGIIYVHECQWAEPGNSCGMWVIPSRSRVGAHIRKWHPRCQVNKTVKCLWDGCTASKAMLKDSMSRHIVTVHLKEVFRCQGCASEFSRKDVYDKHVAGGEVCRKAGAVVVYGTARRAIDTHQVLQGEFDEEAVRYSV